MALAYLATRVEAFLNVQIILKTDEHTVNPQFKVSITDASRTVS